MPTKQITAAQGLAWFELWARVTVGLCECAANHNSRFWHLGLVRHSVGYGTWVGMILIMSASLTMVLTLFVLTTSFVSIYLPANVTEQFSN